MFSLLPARSTDYALAKLTEPFKRSPSSRPERKRPRTTKVPGLDVRLKRLSIGHYRIRVELYDERVIAVPLSWFPRLHKTSVQAREQWTLNNAADTVIWENLGVTIKARQLLVGG